MRRASFVTALGVAFLYWVGELLNGERVALLMLNCRQFGVGEYASTARRAAMLALKIPYREHHLHLTLRYLARVTKAHVLVKGFRVAFALYIAQAHGVDRGH